MHCLAIAVSYVCRLRRIDSERRSDIADGDVAEVRVGARKNRPRLVGPKSLEIPWPVVPELG